MARTRVARIVIGCLSLLPTLAPAQDDVGTVFLDDAGTVFLSDPMNGAAPIGTWGGYIYFRKDFDNGVGYRNGFSNLGWFQPVQLSDDGALFGQGQLFVTDDGEVGGNLGLGYRQYWPGRNALIGGYGFLDFDESRNGNRYEQFSLGFEVRGPRIDFTANAYLPFNKDEQNFLGVNSLNGGFAFGGNNLLFTGAAMYEKAMPGGDFEFGFPVLDPSAFGRLRWFIGGYGYDAEDKEILGVRSRIEAHINEHATIGAAFMHDDTNGGLATVALELRGWSRELPDLRNSNISNRPKLYLPVARQHRIAVDRFDNGFSAPALGEDGTPLEFVWVNNGNAAPGSGTFEDPFHDTPNTAPGADYILVYEGPSGPGNPVLGGIVLEDGQRLYGEGFEFFITTIGTIFGPNPMVVAISDITPWGTSGMHPFVSNPGGSFATLANNNEVGGFNIINTAGPAIAGNGINNFNLFNLNIGVPGFGNAAQGIFLQNASGIGTIDNLTMWGNAGGGIVIDNTNTAPLALSINGSMSADPNVIGGGTALSLIADNSLITANPNAMAGTGINNFRSTGATSGLLLDASNGGVIDAGVADSTFDNTTVGDGVRALLATSGTIILDMTDTTADNAAGNGLSVNSQTNGRFIGTIAGTTLGDSSFSGAGLHGVELIADASPSVMNQLHFLNTTVNNSGQNMVPGSNDGIHIELTNATFFDVAFQNGQIVGSDGDAIDDFQDGASTLNLLVNPSILTDSGENGFKFNLNNASILNAMILDSDLSRSGQNGVVGAGNGIVGTLANNSVATLDLTNSLVAQSNEHGVFLTANSGSTFTGNFDTVDLTDSNQGGGAFDGINVFADGMGTTVTLDLIDTQIDNTFAGMGMQQNALDFFVDNSAVFNYLIGNSGIFMSTPSSMSDSDEDGVFGRVHNSGVANLTIDATPVDDSGSLLVDGDGFDLLVDSMGDLNVTLLNGSSVVDNSRNGFLGVVSGAGSSLDIVVDASTVDSNGDFFLGGMGDGMNLTADMGASVSATIQNGSSVDANGLGGIVMSLDDANGTLLVDGSTVDGNLDGDGIDITAVETATGSTLDVDIIDSSVSNNDENGLLLLVSGAATVGDLNVMDSMFDGNVTMSGMDITANMGATLDIDIDPTSISNNFLDGLRLLATDMGTAVTLDVDATTADMNGEDGFDIDVLAGASLISNFTGGNSSSDNANDGFNLLVDGVGTTAMVDLADTVSSGNGFGTLLDGIGYGYDIAVTNDAMLDLDINGGVNGSDNEVDGMRIVASGMATELSVVTMGGNLNQFNGNLGYGVLLDVSGIAQLEAILPASASFNGLDGVRVEADTVTLITDIGVNGMGSTSMNGGHGVIVDLQNNVQTDAVTLTNFTSDSNALTGVSVIGLNNPITDLLIDAALVSNSMGGDGILIDMTNSNVGTMTVQNGGSSTNMANGLNIELDASMVGELNIVDNDTGGVSGVVGLDFTIVGATNPGAGGGGMLVGAFDIINTSPTLDVTGFLFDIGPSAAGAMPVFDTLNSALGVKFQPFGGTDVTTGLSMINGVAVVPPITPGPGVDDTMDSMGTVLLGGGIPNNTAIMDLAFIDFNPGETFSWDIDVDPAPNMDAPINGDQLAGALITVNFAGGLFIGGSLVQTGPNSSQFIATMGNINSPGFAENTLDGIRINATNGSDIAAMDISRNLVDANGLHGVEIIAVDSELPGPGAPAIVSENTITNHAAGDGFRMINPDTDGAAIGMEFTDNIVTDNTGGVGINLELDTNSTQAGTPSEFSFDGNDVSRNGSFGARFVAVDDAEYELNIGQAPGGAPNLFDANTNAGFGIEVTDTTIGTINAANSTFSNTLAGVNPNFDGDGLAVRAMMSSQVALTVGDPLLMNTSFTGNAGDGLAITGIELADYTMGGMVPGVSIQNVVADGNGDNGILLFRRDNADFGVTTLDTVAGINNVNGSGLFVDHRNFTLPIMQVDIVDSMFDGNNVGATFQVAADAVLVANATTSSFSNNESHGVNVITDQTSQFGNMQPSAGDPDPGAGAIPSTFSSVVVSGNGGNGFNFNFNDDSIASVVIDDAAGPRTVIDGNTGAGINWNSNDNSVTRLDVSATDITNANDVATGDGFNIDVINNADSTVLIDDVGIGSLIASTIFPGLGGDGINVVTNNLGELTLDVTNTRIYTNDGAGYRGVHLGGSNIIASFDNVSSRFNTQRGFDILVRSGGSYDIVNSMASDNGEQGIFFATQATADGSAQIVAPSPIAVPGNRNDFGSVNNVVATLNVIDSTITNNGQNGSPQDRDGLVLAVGSNTRLVSTIAGNTFGGNVLDDVRIFPILSVNPATSVDDPDVGDPDTYVFDPTAELRLAFGIQDTNADNMLDTININTGDQVDVTATGNATNWRLADGTMAAGQFTNTDPFKGGTRSVNGDFDVITSDGGTGFMLNDNVFTQFAVVQDLFNEFVTTGGFMADLGPMFP